MVTWCTVSRRTRTSLVTSRSLLFLKYSQQSHFREIAAFNKALEVVQLLTRKYAGRFRGLHRLGSLRNSGGVGTVQ